MPPAAACPEPSTPGPSSPSSPPTPAAKPSSTNPAPAPQPPRSRQTDHHTASTNTKVPPEHPGGTFPHSPRPHRQRRRHHHAESPRTVVLAVDDPGFLRVQGQPYLSHPFRDRRQHVPCLALADAVDHRVVDVALEPDSGELPRHPGIERIVQEQVSQDR